mmetsp:Transcript_8032/g.9318  ORF Transcript_8032/g.9318 Transcript_8032/m.9318 type:complete len:104 (-) Transcript_8032:106-417(-)
MDRRLLIGNEALLGMDLFNSVHPSECLFGKIMDRDCHGRAALAAPDSALAGFQVAKKNVHISQESQHLLHLYDVRMKYKCHHSVQGFQMNCKHCRARGLRWPV